MRRILYLLAAVLFAWLVWTRSTAASPHRIVVQIAPRASGTPNPSPTPPLTSTLTLTPSPTRTITVTPFSTSGPPSATRTPTQLLTSTPLPPTGTVFSTPTDTIYTKTRTPTATGTPPTPVLSPTTLYTYQISIGRATIIPGDTLLAGSQGDDGEFLIPFPACFSYPFYDIGGLTCLDDPHGPGIIKHGRMNGTIDLRDINHPVDGPDRPGINTCLPNPDPDNAYSIFPYWDDLRTDCPGCGVYTRTLGSSPRRVFYVEWRATYYLCGGTVNFEVAFYEGQPQFDFIYGQLDQQGSGATVGVQRDAANYTQFSCNTASLYPGLRLTFTRLAVTPTPSPTGTPPTATSTATAGAGCPASPSPTPLATATQCPITFNDVDPANPFYNYIRCLACRGIISGYNDPASCTGIPGGPPCFRPNAPITRGQVAKIVSNAAGFAETIPSAWQSFMDVPYGSIFWLYIERLTLHGVISGYSAGPPCPTLQVPCFLPGAYISRGQLAKLVANAAGYSDAILPTQQTFTDVPPPSPGPAQPFWLYIERLYLHGVATGYQGNGMTINPCTGLVEQIGSLYFRPCSQATRGQTSKQVANAFFPNCITPLARP